MGCRLPGPRPLAVFRNVQFAHVSWDSPLIPAAEEPLVPTAARASGTSRPVGEPVSVFTCLWCGPLHEDQGLCVNSGGELTMGSFPQCCKDKAWSLF